MNKLKIKFWKSKLRSRYLAYRLIADEFSCGISLAEHVSSRLREAKASVNVAIRRLQVLDPDHAPKEIK